ncbi:histidine phosphatase family protein [Isachenkonia alkalipeptolytica]|uniref:Histidine phosphatase family protein n=1 Tax=Isachenkonia alkalipeptolytica TaxID=2565777 RepID=A0AA44BFQ2_9CLOT|nr:histidine phosphatase family protein [Isachenkonia alkalipeptolytica]NBG88706.1 histidine phosphatase family protein [Isachenkonia alkalipeptolytica]
MKIHITRHGETKWNQERRMQGSQNSSLTSKGMADAEKLQQRLASVKFDKIYSSPLGRAVRTAEIIRGDRKLPIEKVPQLMEMNFGAWEGRTVEEIERAYGQRYRDFWDAPEKYQPVEGESFEELFQRVERGLKEIIERGEEGEVSLLVAHAVVIKCIYALVKNLPLKEFWNPPFMYGTNLTILEIKGDEKEFILEGDISHLQDE